MCSLHLWVDTVLGNWITALVLFKNSRGSQFLCIYVCLLLSYLSYFDNFPFFLYPIFSSPLQDLGTLVEQLARFLGVSCDKSQLEGMVESCNQLIEQCCNSEALSICRGEWERGSRRGNTALLSSSALLTRQFWVSDWRRLLLYLTVSVEYHL